MQVKNVTKRICETILKQYGSETRKWNKMIELPSKFLKGKFCEGDIYGKEVEGFWKRKTNEELIVQYP